MFQLNKLAIIRSNYKNKASEIYNRILGTTGQPSQGTSIFNAEYAQCLRCIKISGGIRTLKAKKNRNSLV